MLIDSDDRMSGEDTAPRADQTTEKIITMRKDWFQLFAEIRIICFTPDLNESLF